MTRTLVTCASACNTVSALNSADRVPESNKPKTSNSLVAGLVVLTPKASALSPFSMASPVALIRKPRFNSSLSSTSAITTDNSTWRPGRSKKVIRSRRASSWGRGAKTASAFWREIGTIRALPMSGDSGVYSSLPRPPRCQGKVTVSAFCPVWSVPVPPLANWSIDWPDRPCSGRVMAAWTPGSESSALSCSANSNASACLSSTTKGSPIEVG